MSIGNIWVIFGYLVIAGGLLIGSLMVQHGNKLSQQLSEQKILEQQKKSETTILEEVKSLKNEIAKLQKNTEKELISQFPAGYQLFGVINNQIIPYERPSTEEIKISWSTARILRVTKDFIDIMLPDAVLPGNNILQSNTARVKNQEGIISSGHIVVNDWSTFVKVLKSDENKIIAAVGYAKRK